LGEVYRIGGVQAIGALAFGTESVRRVDKIVGPGNRFVAMAKKAVFGAVGIDLIAGPSEILIVADETADPGLVAADLLAQAEHDADAEAVLVTDSERLAALVLGEVNSRLPALATCAVAEESLRRKGLIVLVNDLDEAVAVSNRKAPEHLELHIKDADAWAPRFLHYGSAFIGPGAADSLADYAAGINHTLPTAGSARFSSGLSVRDFLKVQTTLRVDDKGLAEIGQAARLMAEAEGLAGHAASLAARIGR
jgi:histidinol dehydrogenase